MFFMPTQVQRPIELLKTAVRLWQFTFKSVWPFSLLFSIATIIYHWTAYTTQDGKDTWMPLVLYILVCVLSHTSMIDCIHHLIEREDPYNPSLSATFKKSFIFFITVVLTGGAILCGLPLLLIPAFILLGLLGFSPYLAIIQYTHTQSLGEALLEGPRFAIKSMGKSWALVSKHRGFVLKRLVLSVGALGGIGIILYGLSKGLIQVMNSAYANQQAHLFVVFIFNTFLWPFIHALFLTLVYDLNLKESQRLF